MTTSAALNEYSQAEEPARVSCWSGWGGRMCRGRRWRRSGAASARYC